MKCVAIRKEWYEEIKDKVLMMNPYEYEYAGVLMVDVDVIDIDEFNRVSKDLGWMY